MSGQRYYQAGSLEREKLQFISRFHYCCDNPVSVGMSPSEIELQLLSSFHWSRRFVSVVDQIGFHEALVTGSWFSRHFSAIRGDALGKCILMSHSLVNL